MHPALITPADSVIPRGAGILVALRPTVDYSADGSSPPLPSSDTILPEMGEWSFDLGGEKLAFVRDQLAPGLVVLRPRKPVAGRVMIRVGTDLLASYVFGAASDTRPMEKPPVQGARKLIDQGATRRSTQLVSIEVSLQSPPPSSAVAIVTWLITKTTRMPSSFQLTFGSQTTVMESYRAPGRCSEDVPGTLVPYLDDEIAFSWVDEFGRRSEVSKSTRLVE